jgi:hypothetical protein
MSDGKGETQAINACMRRVEDALKNRVAVNNDLNQVSKCLMLWFGQQQHIKARL